MILIQRVLREQPEEAPMTTFDDAIGGIMAGLGSALRGGEILKIIEQAIICCVSGQMICFAFAQVQIATGGGDLQNVPLDETGDNSPFAHVVTTLRLIQPTMVVLVTPAELPETSCRLSCVSGQGENMVQIVLDVAGLTMMPDDGQTF